VTTTRQIKLARLLMVEDDPERVEVIRAWLPQDFRLVVAASAGRARGVLRRDRGRVYAGIMLDLDLQLRAVHESEQFMSGRDVALDIRHNIDRSVPILVHSLNPRAGSVVEQLEGAGFAVTRIPMEQFTREQFQEWLAEVRDNL